jgi:hypothetical protein
MVNIGQYSRSSMEDLVDDSSDRELPVLQGPHFGRNPNYAWYRRLKEKERRRNERKLKIRLKKKSQQKFPIKLHNSTGNRPKNIF